LQMGLLLFLEKKFPQAIAVLERIPANYPATQYVKFKIADAALHADANKLPVPENEKRSWVDLARASLESIPELPTGADGPTTEIYLQARYRLGLILFNAREFEQAEQMMETLLKRLPALNFDNADRRKTLTASMAVLQVRSRSARAGVEYNAGNY